MRLHRARINYTHPEVLESRIAPAVFFVNGTNLTITDSTGADAAGDMKETDAATAVGATKCSVLTQPPRQTGTADYCRAIAPSFSRHLGQSLPVLSSTV